MENILFHPRRPATLRERVESRRSQQNQPPSPQPAEPEVASGETPAIIPNTAEAAAAHPAGTAHPAGAAAAQQPKAGAPSGLDLTRPMIFSRRVDTPLPSNPARSAPRPRPVEPASPSEFTMPPVVTHPAPPAWPADPGRAVDPLRRARPLRPSRFSRPQRVTNHFRQIGRPDGNPVQVFLSDFLANLDMNTWAPRIAAIIIVIAAAAILFSHGRGPDKAMAEALPPEPTVVPQPTFPPGEKTTILVLGSDRREGDGSYRTDVVLLLTIDPQQNTVTALSFPRDLIVKIPRYGDERINVVMQMGGFDLMQDTLDQTYGTRPKYYFMTNFAGFTGLINSIGGIEIDAAAELTDACDLYWSTAGQCTINVGKNTLDGDSALWYIRSRHSTSDFDRMRRAQEVMLGIFHRFMTMEAMWRLPELFAQYSQDVETNMPLDKILSLLPVAAKMAQDPGQIQRFAIPEYMTANWIMDSGASVLLPDYEAIKEIVKEAGASTR